MKRNLTLVLAVALAATFTFGGAMSAFAAAKTAVFIGATQSMNASDGLVVKRLQGLGYAVTLVNHPDAATVAPTNYGLVVISSSVGSGNVAGAADLYGSSAPVFIWEAGNLDEFGLMPGGPPLTPIETGKFAIAAPKHPIAAGLSGKVQIFKDWDEAAMAHSGETDLGTTVAYLDDSTSFGIVAVEKGDKLLNDATAPGRRVHYASGDVLWEYVTPDGWKLFDQSIAWLTR